MTKEELEKEAKNSWWNDNNCSGALPTEKIYECGYLAGAEPREKRIAELEAEVKEWKDKADLWCKTANLKDHNIMINKELEKENAELKEKLKTAYRKGMRHMAKALKDYDRTDGAWTDYFEHIVDKVLQREQLDFEEYGTLAEQLTKAKEIIKKIEKIFYSGENAIKRLSKISDILAEAEQFISEVEK